MKIYNQNDYPLVIAGNNPPDGVYDKEGKLIAYVWSIMYVGCYICSIVNGLLLLDFETDPVGFNNLAKEKGLFGADNAFFDQTRIQEMYPDVTSRDVSGWNPDEAQKGLDDPNSFVVLGLNINLPNKKRSTHFVLLYSMNKIADPNGGDTKNRNYYGPDSSIIKTLIFTKNNQDMAIQQELLDAVNAQNWGSESEKQARIGEIEAGDYTNLIKYAGSEVRGWLLGEQTKNIELENQIDILKKEPEQAQKVQISSITTAPTLPQDIIKPQSVARENPMADMNNNTIDPDGAVSQPFQKPNLKQQLENDIKKPATDSTLFKWIETNITALGFGGGSFTVIVTQVWNSINDVQRLYLAGAGLIILAVSYYLTSQRNKK